jgi:predicted flap endonuclease-1-like 5' DNA nuclease
MIADEAPGEIVRLGVDDAMYQHFGLDTSKPINHKIDGVLSVVGSEALAEYLLERMEEAYPTRDYNRVISVTPFLSKHYPQAINDFDSRIRSYVGSIIFEEQQQIEKELEEVEGFIDVHEKRDEIDERIGKIIEADENLKEIASKLDELKPLLDKIDGIVKAKEDEKRKKEQEEKAELEKKKQADKERQAKEKAELIKKYGEICSKYDLELYDIPNIGPTTARKLKELGIASVIDLAAADVDVLTTEFTPPDIPRVSPPIPYEGGILRIKIKKNDDDEKPLSREDRIKAAKENVSKYIEAAKKLLEDTLQGKGPFRPEGEDVTSDIKTTEFEDEDK